MPKRETPNCAKPGISVRRWLAVAGIVVVGAVVAFGVVYSLIPIDKVKPKWVASSGAPTPPDFLYATFPLNTAVSLCDVPDGKPVGVLARALVNSQEEIDAGGWVQVREPAGKMWAPISGLGYLPSPDARKEYFAAFETAYKARYPSDFRSASLKLHQDSAGVATITLRLSQDDYWQSYVYEVSSGQARPLEMYLVSGIEQGFEGLTRFMFSIGASIFFLFVTALIAVVAAYRRRLNARRPAPR